MPEDTKKNQQKGKHEPKDQRKRRGRQHAAPIEKQVEKEPEPHKVTAPEKPAYEPPPPEFYKSLKRETDEILKITEEANSKYKKKEIQSNWAKYEMPIESYEEIDEQENLGADYETLIQAPLTVGAHFQFKHEKSWDITTGPSPYDKYFDINMDNLSIALSTIPFYDRNSIDTSFFNESDIQTMNHRAAKYKHKYYNDKKFATPEIEAQDNILKSLKSNNNVDSKEMSETSESIEANEDRNDKMLNQFKDIKLEECEEPEQIASKELVNEGKNTAQNTEILSEDKKIEINDNIEPSNVTTEKPVSEISISEPIESSYETKDQHSAIKESEKNKVSYTPSETESSDSNKLIDNHFDDFVQNEVVKNKEPKIAKKSEMLKPDIVPKEKKSPIAIPQKEDSPTKNPIIESPEDLEKWLDDFLDG
nr:probable serine/threonine-protein kinase kinX isoform X2 [Maniola hyperantus]